MQNVLTRPDALVALAHLLVLEFGEKGHLQSKRHDQGNDRYSQQTHDDY